MFTNHNGIKLEVNNKKITRKSPIIWKFKLHSPKKKKNPQVKEEVSREIRKYFELNKKF